jgi:hypothetical protein
MPNEADQFDPYHKWLGIPPKDQPPNHYRLLGIQTFEDDPDTIANAADQRMAHVRSFQSGKYSAISQRLLNELAAARVALLKPDRKSAYDAALRKSHHADAPSAQPAFEDLASVIGHDEYASARNRPRRTQRKLLPVAVVLVAVVLLVAVGALFFLSRNDAMPVVKETPPQVPISPTPIVRQPSEPTPKERPVEAAPAPVIPTPKIEDVPVEPVVEKPNTDSNVANAATVETMEPAVVTVEGMRPLTLRIGPRPAFLMEATFYDWVAKPKASVANGVLNFRVEKTGIVYLGATWEREGNKNGDWQSSRLTKEALIAQGWQELGPCDWDRRKTLFKRVCNEGETYSIRTNKYWPPALIIEGLPPASSEELNESDLVEWARPKNFAKPANSSQNLTSDPKTEERKPLDGKWVDALRLVIPTTHAVHGEWKRVGPAISVSKADGPCRIAVPVSPSESYDLTLEFTRTKGDVAGLIFPIAGRHGMVSLDKTTSGNEIFSAAKDVEIATGERHKVEAWVRLNDSMASVDVDLDGKPIVRWKGNASQVSVADLWELPSPGLIGLTAGTGSSVTFHSLRLREKNSISKPAQQLESILLARDVHRGKSGAVVHDNVYQLNSAQLVALNSTSIRFQVDSAERRSDGKVSISGDGKEWVVAGEWSKASLAAAAAQSELWHVIDLRAMPASKLNRLYVKFDRTSGNPFLIEETQWVGNESTK